MVGIGGIGTSGLAAVLAQAGAVVTGSEDSRTILAGELLERFPQIRVYDGYSASHLDGVDRVIHTVAARPDNPELAEARRQGVPVFDLSAGTEPVPGRHGGVRGGRYARQDDDHGDDRLGVRAGKPAGVLPRRRAVGRHPQQQSRPLDTSRTLTNRYRSAQDGDVALTARINAAPGTPFTLALGSGPPP